MQSDDVIITIIEVVTSVIAALLGWLSYRISTWIKVKTNNAKVEELTIRIFNIVETLVKEAEQTVVAEMKATKHSETPGSRRLTPIEAAGIRLSVVNKAKSYLGEQGIKELTSVLGIASDSVKSYLESYIEEAVLNLKRKDS